MKVLAIGDLVGENGVKKLKETLPKIREQEKIDFVIVNAENSAGGMGITTKIFNYNGKPYLGQKGYILFC